VSEQSNTQRLPLLFTSKEFDEETQLYYYGARYYDPRTSVWQSADPALADHASGAHDPRLLAVYSYSWNNPLVLYDPDGRDVWKFTKDFAIGAKDGVYDIGVGIYQTARHPIQTGKEVGYAIANFRTTAQVIWSETKESVSACYGGDGYACGHIAPNLVPVGGAVAGTVKAVKVLRAAGRAAEAAKTAERLSILQALRARALQLAGFARDGAPVILDENIEATGAATALRQAGFNVRGISEIFGRGGVSDPEIMKLAETIGARVLTSDRGRDLAGGFGARAIKVDQRAISPSSLARLLKAEGL
jgi:RHS repeat-associated protein